MRKLKYISIILLSFILCESNVLAQKKKNSKSAKRVVTRMKNKTPVIAKTTTEAETPTPVANEPQAETIDVATLDLKNTELENLQAQMKVLNNKMLEKQDEYRSIDSKIEEINEAYMNLEQKQNKSKNSCEAISVKKMDEIKGWLIATVASSGVGTAANATATVTSFLQKDEKQVDKQNQKSLERATEKAKNKEIKNLEKEQKSLSKNIKETNELLKNENLTQDEIDGLLDHNRQNNEDFTNITNNINNLKENPYTGKVNAKTTDYEKQAKINKNLSTASKVSSIVGTVASGAAIVTSAVATGLVSSISKQVKKCKETF